MRLKLISTVRVLLGKQIKNQLVMAAINIFVHKKQNPVNNVKENVYQSVIHARHITTPSNTRDLS